MKCRKLPPRLPVLSWSSQELGESVPSRYLHFSIPSSAIPNIRRVYSVFYIYLQICYLLLAAGLARGGG